MQLASSALGYLLDHIVAGRSILPGAAMFEMAAAAGRTASDAAAGRDVGLLDVAIPAPVILQVGARQSVECVMHWGSGSVQLQSTAPSGQGVFTPHLHCAIWILHPLEQRLCVSSKCKKPEGPDENRSY